MPKSRPPHGTVGRFFTRADESARLSPRQAGTAGRGRIRAPADDMIHGVRDRYGERDFGIQFP